MSTLNVTNIAGPSNTGTAATLSSINGGPISGARNRIINGDMRIDQRNAGAAVTAGASGAHAVDRWLAQEDTDGTMTAQRSTTAPSGFSNSLLITTGTADASLAASQYAFITQLIEGFNTADLAWGTASASSVALSFWVRSSLTGTFGGAVRNNAGDRSYPFSYSVSSANTWEYKTIVIPGDTGGTWLTNNEIGIRLSFGLGAGTDWSGTANAWVSGNRMTVTGAVSLIGTSGATFYITGVQLEAGTVATPFERRSYGQELSLCQRYFESYTSSTYPIISGAYNPPTLESYATWTFAVMKRATPTFAISSGSWAVAPTTITPGVSNVQFGRPTNYFYLNTSSVVTASAEL